GRQVHRSQSVSRMKDVMQHNPLPRAALPVPPLALANLLAPRSAIHLALLAQDDSLLQSLEIHTRVFEKGVDIFEEGRACSKVYIVVAGWACSYRIMRSGSRQVIDF